jgi:hypothetical protein
MYKFNIEQCTQQINVLNHNNRSDIVNDYIPDYFIPLMNLTKNIIELIEFFHEEI